MLSRVGFLTFFLAAVSGCSLIVAPDAGLIGDDGGGGQGAAGGEGGQGGGGATTTTGGQGGEGGAGGGCTTPAMCPAGNECQTATCDAGVCGLANVSQGTAIAAQTAGDCAIAVCNGVGGTETVPDNVDLPNDNNDCTADVCTAGVPSNDPLSAGTACGAGLVCDGAAQCVGCVDATMCPGVDDDCQTRTCTVGVCGFSFTSFGTLTSTQTSGDCNNEICDGAGNAVAQINDTDVDDDGLTCTVEGCSSGAPTSSNEPAGTACSDGGGVQCDGGGSCVECVLDTDCGIDTECQAFSCTLGSCGVVNTPGGTPLTTGQSVGDCQELQCDGAGGVTSADDNVDLPVDGAECTDDVCTAGVPSNPGITSGTACTEGGGLFCNGMGSCVECVSNGDCISGVCSMFMCQSASCADNIQNGLETDIDCGGGTCAACNISQMCGIDNDCYTGNCDASACAAVLVLGTTPADSATAVAVGSSISVTFSGPVAPATVTSTTTLSSGACTGNVRVSADDFTSCIPMASPTAAMSAGNTVATLTPAPGLSFGTTYKVRVTSAVLDVQSQAVVSATSTTGFTTEIDVLGSVPGGNLVISQVYGGGGNSGAPFTNDFIEIHNRTTTAIDLSGMSVQYASSSGTTWSVTPLAGVLPPGAFYLVEEAAGAGGLMPLPTPDASGSIAMAASAGKVALVANTTALSGSCPTGVIDLVGYGTANCFEGTGGTNAPSATTSVQRNVLACRDANDNVSDFSAAAPAPRNTASPAGLCAPETANESGLPGELDFCNVQFPVGLSLTTGLGSGMIFGQVFDLGVTEAAGADPSIVAEFGYGPRNSNPQHQAGWTFVAAAYNAQAGNNDEYQASITAPAPGNYSYAFRFSKSGGLWWTYCDVNGAGSNIGLSFETTQLPLMTVSP